MLERGEEKRKADWKQAERERLRDTFAAAALTGLLSNVQRYQNGPLTEQAFEIADFMLKERKRTSPTPQPRTAVLSTGDVVYYHPTHDAVPAAKATNDGGTPKDADGTGNTPALSESEREAIEQMLDEASGKACAESWVPDILRNLLERLK
jgi:hypothetical protein